MSNCIKCYNNIPWGKENEQCNQCLELLHDKDSVEHDSAIRCPKCEYITHEFPHHEERDDLYAEGEHCIGCDECGHTFIIEAIASYSFISPEVEVLDDES